MKSINRDEKLLQALASVKKVLSDFGVDEINNTIEMDDGAKETFDCMKVIEDHIVNYINSGLHIYEYDTLEIVVCPHCNKILSWKEIVEIVQQKNEIKMDELTEYGSAYVNDFMCPHCHNLFDLSLAVTLHSDINSKRGNNEC